MTVIYQNKVYRFIGYSDLPGLELTAERDGKFYRLPVKECQLIRSEQGDRIFNQKINGVQISK